MGSVPRERLGVTGGVYATMSYLGNLLGVDILGSHFSARQAAHFQIESLTGLKEKLAAASFSVAFQETLLLAFWIAALGLVKRKCLLLSIAIAVVAFFAAHVHGEILALLNYETKP